MITSPVDIIKTANGILDALQERKKIAVDIVAVLVVLFVYRHLPNDSATTMNKPSVPPDPSGIKPVAQSTQTTFSAPQ